ncbi:unnamed protein product [Didymodactylos carnosus]|uniref:Uncharacterized protein n=1 Tax=Didymodactylos carnosus TaxID=1234261 RepID=A0A813T467_9BILA|nr:unnamed protein product [Didymodactylos carnosus]CAF1193382.1 unnamed protein product [Didymodactylos carnosus]CAF3589775.1 unnamed protein product [Didymodactylos carnosus]CAF4003682.1 unnamed protein product [Didymodactylos carnosus]
MPFLNSFHLNSLDDSNKKSHNTTRVTDNYSFYSHYSSPSSYMQAIDVLNNDELISFIHRLMDEREQILKENEYLRAKLNESLLIETINEIKGERDILLKLLVNTTNNNEQQQRISREQSLFSQPSYSNDSLHYPPPPSSQQAQQYSTLKPSMQTNQHLNDKSTRHGLELSPDPTYDTNNYVVHTPRYETTKIRKTDSFRINKHNENFHHLPTTLSPPSLAHIENQNNEQKLHSSPRQRRYRTKNERTPTKTIDSSSTVTNATTPNRRRLTSSTATPTAVYRIEGNTLNANELANIFSKVKQTHPNKKIVVYKVRPNNNNTVSPRTIVNGGHEQNQSLNSSTNGTAMNDDFNRLVDEMCIKHGVLSAEYDTINNENTYQLLPKSNQIKTNNHITKSSKHSPTITSLLQHHPQSPFQPIQYRSHSLQDLTQPDNNTDQQQHSFEPSKTENGVNECYLEPSYSRIVNLPVQERSHYTRHWIQTNDNT